MKKLSRPNVGNSVDIVLQSAYLFYRYGVRVISDTEYDNTLNEVSLHWGYLSAMHHWQIDETIVKLNSRKLKIMQIDEIAALRWYVKINQSWPVGELVDQWRESQYGLWVPATDL